jgi:hypothetical protein
VETLGHDAFTSRHSEHGKVHVPGIFGSDNEHHDVIKRLLQDDNGIDDWISLGNYLFVGKCIELKTPHGGEFEYYLKFS